LKNISLVSEPMEMYSEYSSRFALFVEKYKMDTILS
jgi:hypothetical protein